MLAAASPATLRPAGWPHDDGYIEVRPDDWDRRVDPVIISDDSVMKSNSDLRDYASLETTPKIRTTQRVYPDRRTRIGGPEKPAVPEVVRYCVVPYVKLFDMEDNYKNFKVVSVKIRWGPFKRYSARKYILAELKEGGRE
jgi:hypothetical protein